MKVRILILAACASMLALMLAATTDTFAKDEKTFLDGFASKNKAKGGTNVGGGAPGINSNLYYGDSVGNKKATKAGTKPRN
jgi:hypothetical protein